MMNWFVKVKNAYITIYPRKKIFHWAFFCEAVASNKSHILPAVINIQKTQNMTRNLKIQKFLLLLYDVYNEIAVHSAS